MEEKNEIKERVREELKDLVEKMNKLQSFLFSEKSLSLTKKMRYTMRNQLGSMQSYAGNLISRLEMWDSPDDQAGDCQSCGYCPL